MKPRAAASQGAGTGGWRAVRTPHRVSSFPGRSGHEEGKRMSGLRFSIARRAGSSLVTTLKLRGAFCPCGGRDTLVIAPIHAHASTSTLNLNTNLTVRPCTPEQLYTAVL